MRAPSGTMRKPFASAIGRRVAPRTTATKRSRPMPRCHPIRSASGTRADPSAAMNSTAASSALRCDVSDFSRLRLPPVQHVAEALLRGAVTLLASLNKYNLHLSARCLRREYRWRKRKSNSHKDPIKLRRRCSSSYGFLTCAWLVDALILLYALTL